MNSELFSGNAEKENGKVLLSEEGGTEDERMGPHEEKKCIRNAKSNTQNMRRCDDRKNANEEGEEGERKGLSLGVASAKLACK